MKINENFKVRAIAGENLIVKQGAQTADMTKIISLNDSALLLWKALSGREFTLDEAAAVLINTYGIEAERARLDAQAWTNQLIKCGVMHE